MRLSTTDLYESSYFLCRGARLERVEIERRRRPTAVFFFEEADERLSELQEAYHNNTMTFVNMSEFRRNMEYLKDVMFNKLKKSGGRQGRHEFVERTLGE